MKKHLRSNSKTLLLFTFVICLSSALKLQALVAPDQVYRSGRIDLATQFDYYKTTANFDANSSKADLAGSSSYQLFNFTPALRWGFFENAGLRFGTNIGSATSENSIATRKNSSLNRIDFGLDYRVFEVSGFEAILDFEYSSALEKVALQTGSSFNNDTALNNDGANEIKPSLLIRFQGDGFYPYAHIGYNQRSEGLSSLLTYGGGAEFRFEDFGVGTSLQGYSTVKNDEKTLQQRKLVTDIVNAGSFKFFSVNPSHLDLQVFINFATSENLALKLFAGYDLLGTNTSQGLLAGAQVRLSFDDVISLSNLFSSSNKSRAKVKTQNNKKFKEETEDGVDQNYFKPLDEPTQDNYIKPMDGSSVPTSEESEEELAKKKKGSTQNVQQNQQQGVQQSLDELGYTIKLKKKKKK